LVIFGGAADGLHCLGCRSVCVAIYTRLQVSLAAAVICVALNHGFYTNKYAVIWTKLMQILKGTGTDWRERRLVN